MSKLVRKGMRLTATAGCLLTGIAGITGIAHAGTASPRTADYAAAREEWVSAQVLSGGAYQAVPLILVVADLRHAVDAGADQVTYDRVINTIVTFGRLPDAMLTPVERRESDEDVAAIDHFFGFAKSPWSGGCISHGSEASAAAHAWSQEPKGTRAGISEAWLKVAEADLEHGLRSDAGDRSCYPAAILDLKSLQSATARQIAGTPTVNAASIEHPGAVQVAWADILWLNNWLSFEEDNPGGISVLTA
jgi:hypothetical protein